MNKLTDVYDNYINGDFMVAYKQLDELTRSELVELCSMTFFDWDEAEIMPTHNDRVRFMAFVCHATED